MNILSKNLIKVAGLTAGGLWLTKEERKTHNWIFRKDPFKDLDEDPKKIYFWGNGFYQAKPGSIPEFPNFSPKAQKLSMDSKKRHVGVPDLVDVEGSEECLIGVDRKGNVWTFDNKQISSKKSESSDALIKQKVKSKSGEVRTRTIYSENVISNLQNINTKSPARSIRVVLSNVYVLAENGKVYRSKLDLVRRGSPGWKEISSVKNLRQIEAGKGHLLMLDKEGQVFAMGDDTYGQCGSGDLDRKFSGPFISRVVHNPQLVTGLEGQKVKKIYSGGSHNFVLTESGQVFGWGFNRYMQLGHEEQYAAPENPLMALFAPVNFSYFFKDAKVKDIELGLDFSLFICESPKTGFTQVFGMGHNSKGQMGSGFSRHVQKLTKLEPLSDFETKSESGERVPLRLEISCGDQHCLARGSNGSLLIWGDNMYGQLGNKKRSFTGSPIFVSDFRKKNVHFFKAFGKQSFVNVSQK